MAYKNLHSLFSIDIPDKEPFKNDVLNRKPFAEAIESLITVYSGGVVIALNGEWGSGKTTFIDMLNKDLSHRSESPYCTAFLNAWEHEYFNDPTMAVLSCLQTILPTENEDHIVASTKLRNLNDCAKSISKSFLSNCIDKLSAGFISKDSVQESIDICNKNRETNYLYEASSIDSYKQQMANFSLFKEAFADYVNYIYNESGNPIVIFVDELDRCNPTYSVALLERIKHVFAIEHVVFILSIDKTQLCNAILGYFGSEKINSPEYLRRFIDVEISMPKARTFDFLSACIKKMGLIQEGRVHERSTETMCYALKMTTERKTLSLRQIEKLITLISLSFNMVRSDVVSFYISVPLAYIRCFDYSFFKKIYSKQATMVEVYDKFFDLYMYGENKSPDFFIALLYMYQDYCSLCGQPQENFCCVDENGKFSYTDKCPEFNDRMISDGRSKSQRYGISHLLHALNLYMDLMPD